MKSNKLILILALAMYSGASSAGPGPIGGFGSGFSETAEYADYECLPPFHIEEFDKHLRAGTLDDAIPWTVVSGLRVAPHSRLIFNQRLGFEFLIGTFIGAEDGAELEIRHADALTGTRYNLNLLKAVSQRKREKSTPFLRSLISLSEKNTHLFRVQSTGFEALDSKTFPSLILPGTLVFTHDAGALLLSSDRQRMAVCAKVDAYKDDEMRQEWLAIHQEDFDPRKLALIVNHFVSDPEFSSILNCEELLAGRSN